MRAETDRDHNLLMSTLWSDLRIAVRQLRRQPSFTVAVVSTLALAVGANIAVFSVVNTVILRELPFASPAELVWISSVRPDNPDAPFTLPEFVDYRSQTRALSGLAAYGNWSASIAEDGITERLQGARMSANSFEVLGISAAAGRLLRDDDDRADAPRVVVVSHRLAQRLFGGSANAIGRSLRINSESMAIVGVLPAHFPLPLRDIDVVTALAPDRDPLRHVRGSVNFLRLFARLGPGTTTDRAQGELNTICRSLRQQFPVEYARKDGVRLAALHDAIVGGYRQSLIVLLAAVGVVLATALANLVCLALIRANDRQSELSIRVAVGASRLQLIRPLTVESLVIAVAGSTAGWMIAAWATDAALPWVPSSIPRIGEVRLDPVALLFAAGLTVVVTALLGVAPVRAIARTQAGDALRLASRGAIGDRWNHRVRNTLVIAEISAALVLLLATMVLVQNVLMLQGVDPGFKPEGVFQARVSVPPTYRSPQDVARFYDRLSGRLTGLPGVQHVGVISVAPLSGLLATVPFAVADQPPRDRRDVPQANLRAISPDYLSAAGTRIIQGRQLSEADEWNTPRVALVSAALAERFLAARPLGRQLMIDDNNSGPRAVEVVGVVEDVRQTALDAPPGLDVYIPLRQVHQDGVAILRNNQFWMVKTSTAPAAFAATFLTHLRAVDPDAAVSTMGPMRRYLDAWLGPRRFNLGLFGVFSCAAVVLAVCGLYAIVSYTVSQRRREIGVRVAIGATQLNVQRLVLGQAVRLAIGGTAAGLCLAGVARPLIASFVQDVSIDPAIAVATTALLIAVVTMAAWLPARRAARIDPTEALRAE